MDNLTMKKGQILCSHYHKGKAIITRVGKTNVEMTWFIHSDGSLADSKGSFSIKEIQKEEDKGGLTISNLDDPNLAFLIRRCKACES